MGLVVTVVVLWGLRQLAKMEGVAVKVVFAMLMLLGIVASVLHSQAADVARSGPAVLAEAFAPAACVSGTDSGATAAIASQ